MRRTALRTNVAANFAWAGLMAVLSIPVSVRLSDAVTAEGARIGAGSVVTKDVPPVAIVAGNPARVLRAP